MWIIYDFRAKVKDQRQKVLGSEKIEKIEGSSRPAIRHCDCQMPVTENHLFER